MSNARELLLKLVSATGKGMVTLAPGPMKLKVGKADTLAAEILLYFLEMYPEITMGDMQDALTAAIWWSTFYAALESEQEPQP